MIRRPPRSTPLYSSAASDVYKRQVLVALLLMRLSPVISSRSGSLFRAIRGGLAHIFHDRFLATLLINFGSLLFCGSTYTILLALFAKTELRTTPAGLGVLYTAIGIGTIVGSLAVASLGDFRRKGRLLMVCRFRCHYR